MRTVNQSQPRALGNAGAAEPAIQSRSGERLVSGSRTSGNAASSPAAGHQAATRRTYVRPRSGWQAVDLAELWRARDLLWIFTIRDIKVRYKQTFFGFAWALIVPVIQVLVFSVFFGSVLGVSDRVDEVAGRALPYPLFSLAGLIVWNFFKMTVDGASNSLLVNAGLIRKIYVPRLVLPLSALGKPAVDTAVVFVLLLGLTAWYAADPTADVSFSRNLLLTPLLLVGSALPAIAIGLIVAAITVTYRDLQYVMPFFTSILFFLSPVVISVEMLSPGLAWLFYLNPVSGFVEAHRAAVMGLPFDRLGLGISVGLSLMLLVYGLFYFARVERRFADIT